MAIFYNKQIIAGLVGKYITYKELENDKAVLNFSVATTEYVKDEKSDKGYSELTEWHKVTVWDHIAKRINENIESGVQIFVDGVSKTNVYTPEGKTEKKYEKYIKGLCFDPYIPRVRFYFYN